MTTITPVYGHQLTVQIGDGESPEVFAHPALINTTRGITFTTATESDELVDIGDQSKPAQTFRRARAFDTKIDGAGMVHSSSVKEYADWAVSGEIKNVKVAFGNAVATGPFILTSFQISGERAKTTEAQITLEQAGPVTITASS
jgi:predicted secreted protein